MYLHLHMCLHLSLPLSAGLRKLESFFACLITMMSITFGYIYIVSGPDQGDIIQGLVVPACSSDAVDQAIGVLGAVIMPHNIYL